MRKHTREKRITETGLFSLLVLMKPRHGEFSLLNMSLCTLLFLVVKPLGMIVTNISLNFYSKITPLCPSYKSKTITMSIR